MQQLHRLFDEEEKYAVRSRGDGAARVAIKLLGKGFARPRVHRTAGLLARKPARQQVRKPAIQRDSKIASP
ncbi:hypothetical protein GXP70_19415 [Paenibacillus lycopersici]|uniref:Uncharacterized protein n=1 Tax=Paenibacillus lycopersici TaxID=2704462 RepID=A0A6C0G3H2_9BACL|nr:hypothetical protein [Paenibacillus lycopersici]QHT61934.1 hypothetical protein GXP70_19415 [Paenibacillus lycopersici]